MLGETEALVKEVCDWVTDRCAEAGIGGIEITPDTDLLDKGVLDSLGFIALVAFIEDSTGTQIDLLEIDEDGFSRVRGLCEFALGCPVQLSAADRDCGERDLNLAQEEKPDVGNPLA